MICFLKLSARLSIENSPNFSDKQNADADTFPRQISTSALRCGFDPGLRDQSLDIDRLCLQWRNTNCHRERHEAIRIGSRLAFAGFTIAGVVQNNHGMAHTQPDRKDRVPAMREVTYRRTCSRSRNAGLMLADALAT